MAANFYSAKILDIRDETVDAYSLVLEAPENEEFRYKAGQYITVRVWIEGEEQRRAYSLSSSPAIDEHLIITIKRVEGGLVSNYLRDQLKPGDLIEIMAPMGNFFIEPSGQQERHYILLGAGSGITPLMSMLKTVLLMEEGSKVSLWYGNRTISDIIFKEELLSLKSEYGDRLSIIHVLSRAGEEWNGFKGRLDKERIYDLVLELFMVDTFRKRYFICGPTGMMEAAIEALDKHAVDPAHIFQEYFDAPLVEQHHEGDEVSDGEETFELTTQKIAYIIDGETHTLTVSPEETILDAALAAGLDPPYSCKGGVCTSCMGMMHSGVVSMDVTLGLNDEELEAGWVLSCQAHPLTDDVEIEIQ